MESLLASRRLMLLYLKLHSNEFSDKFVVKYYHPNESADLAAAKLRASSGDADPL
jgi:hypothetical protein